MRLTDPPIEDWVKQFEGLHPADTKAVIDFGRMTAKKFYGMGFDNGVAADKAATVMDANYYPETKTCPRCGHKWGGA